MWVALAIGLAVVAAAGTWFGLRARGSALDEGTTAATRAGTTVVAPILAADGVNGPLEGRRARTVRDDLEHALANRAEGFGRVRVFTVTGDVLLDGRREVASSEAIGDAIAEAWNHGSAGLLHDGAFLGYVAITTPQGERVVELAAHDGRFVPTGLWPVVVPVAAVLALLCLGLATVAARDRAAEIPRASRYHPAIPRRPQAADARDDVLPTVSVFAVGDDDLEIRHDDERIPTPPDAQRTTRSVDARTTDARLTTS
jgi:hypothetical protein